MLPISTHKGHARVSRERVRVRVVVREIEDFYGGVCCPMSRDGRVSFVGHIVIIIIKMDHLPRANSCLVTFWIITLIFREVIPIPSRAGRGVSRLSIRASRQKGNNDFLLILSLLMRLLIQMH